MAGTDHGNATHAPGRRRHRLDAAHWPGRVANNKHDGHRQDQDDGNGRGEPRLRGHARMTAAVGPFLSSRSAAGALCRGGGLRLFRPAGPHQGEREQSQRDHE